MLSRIHLSLYLFLILTTLLLLTTTTTNAQDQQAPWDFLGPDNYGGTTRALQVDIDEPERVYAGCITGGVWVSNNTGKLWQPLGDIGSPIVSCIVQAANGDLYVGTGDFFEESTGLGYGGRPGNGIYKSTNKGQSFQRLNGARPAVENSVEGDWQYIIELAADPSNVKTLFAATNTGLFWTKDAGATWALVPNLPKGIAYDVVVGKQGEVHTFIDDTYYYAKDGKTFITNSGEELGEMPFIEGRKSLAISPTHSEYVYAVVMNQSNCMHVVYQSETGGDIWFEIGRRDVRNLAPFTEIQPYFWYDSQACKGDYAQELVVNPADPTHIIVAGAVINQWSARNHWQDYSEVRQYGNGRYFRSNDVHKIVFSPHNSKHIYIGTDAGIFRSLNGGTSFHYRVLGYHTAQVTGMDFMADGSLIAGTKMQGLQHLRFRDVAPQSGEVRWRGNIVDVFASKIRPMIMPLLNEGHALRSLNMENFPWFLGDAIDCIPRSSQGGCFGDGIPDNGAAYYLENAYWEDQDTQESQCITGDSLGVVWYSQNIAGVNPDGGFYAGSESSWELQDTLLDDTGSPTVITTTRFTADGNTAWVGSNSGALMRLENYQDDAAVKTTSFTPSFFAQGDKQRYITAIAIDPNDPNKVLIALGGFGESTYLYGTSSGMSDFASFKAIQNDLPACPIYDVMIDANDANHLLAATEKGLYHSYNNGLDWTLDEQGMPAVPIHRLKQLPHPTIEGQLIMVAAAYGGGIYATGFSPDQLSTAIDEVGEKEHKKLQVYPNPTNEFIQIEGGDVNKEMIVTLYDLQGRLIKTESLNANTRWSLKGLTAGTYLLKITSGEQVENHKIMIY